MQHAALTGASLHEPKGASGAANNTVYVSDGAGSGAWEKITEDSIDTSSIKNTNLMVLTYTIADINTAGSFYLVVPKAGSLVKAWSVIDSALATADNIISFEIANVAVTNGSITITQSGSATGDVDSCTPTALNTLTEGQALEIVNNGGTSSTTRCTLTLVFDIG